MNHRVIVPIVFLVVSGAACPQPPPDPVCIPGTTQECVCPGAVMGAQACRDDGDGYDDCVCPSADAGERRDAGEDSDLGSFDRSPQDHTAADLRGAVPVDAGADANLGATDANPGADTSIGSVIAVCGDGSCNGDESAVTCSPDCGSADPPDPVCGNHNCEADETDDCPADCPVEPCGNGSCTGEENAYNCPADCGCGDGRCADNETNALCPQDCASEAQIEECIAACWDLEAGGCFLIFGEEVLSGDYIGCKRTCYVASAPEVDRFLDCTPDGGCASCVWDELMPCGNGRCDLFEDDTVDVGGCPEDCSGYADTWLPCLEACVDYRDQGCLMSVVFDECAANCWGMDPGRRVGFVECAAPFDHDECFAKDCLGWVGQQCGDFECDPGESRETCSFDCAEDCGDYYCSSTESEASCPEDCSMTCGDGYCALESCASCPDDCGGCASGCGDETCGPDEGCESCAYDCGACVSDEECGDEHCGLGESCSSCALDCGNCGGPDTGACFGEFQIIRTAVINSRAGLGNLCNESYSNCLDGTSVTFLDDGTCICTAMCGNLAHNPGVGESCAPGSDWICTSAQAVGSDGDWALICAREAWNLCTSET